MSWKPDFHLNLLNPATIHSHFVPRIKIYSSLAYDEPGSGYNGLFRNATCFTFWLIFLYNVW